MLTVPLAFGFAGIVPWWIVITLIGRDAVLAATLPLLRSRGPDGAAGHLHRQGCDVRAHVGVPVGPARAVGRAVEPRHSGVRLGVLIWGLALYLWSAVLYLIQVGMVMRQMPKVHSRG